MLSQGPITWDDTATVNTALTVNDVNGKSVSASVVFDGAAATGVLKFEGTIDGVNWVPIGMNEAAAPGTYVTSITASASGAAGYTGVILAGFIHFRVRISTALTAGHATVTIGVTQGIEIETPRY